jgi:hypothetical protein
MGSMITLALAALIAAPGVEAPVWHKDYAGALKVGKETGKPLAVFIGNGSTGWQKIAREGTIDSEAAKVLSEKYVCLYLDLTQESEKQVAESFQVHASPALIISSHGGQFQAFRHEGELGQTELKSDLNRFSDPQRPVLTTEGASVSRASLYPPVDQQAPVRYGPAPTYFQPQWGTLGTAPGASSCPRCNGIR